MENTVSSLVWGTKDLLSLKTRLSVNSYVLSLASDQNKGQLFKRTFFFPPSSVCKREENWKREMILGFLL